MEDGAQTIEALQVFEPTRAAGLERLRRFQPAMGKRYAAGRNYDLGPGAHTKVSQLSPYTRRRLITEQEAATAALQAHSPAQAEKFVHEVFWRTYFKGWLERRPSVWTAYTAGLQRDIAALGEDRKLAKRVAAAEEGRTGLDCFDAWAMELEETGYLHNHARMWFASIWIFTLGLPWRLGADLFYRKLLDGDPASNTLSWRWVAGLHTKGKAYAAQAWNIAKFTQNRFEPGKGALVEAVVPLEESWETPAAGPLRDVRAFDADAPAVLLLTEEDCRLEELEFGAGWGDFAAVATLTASALRSPRGATGEAARAFEAGALADQAARLSAAGAKADGAALTALDPAARDDLIAWARDHGAAQIVTPYVTTGPLRDWFDAAAPDLAEAGLRVVEPRRDWDRLTWPYATAGFFKVKQKIPSILSRLGVEEAGA
ncbi:MAG: FAD-binding domain-containing protein [Pseudomonadota bacterium]